MTETIALALIKQLVVNGQLDANDIAAICENLCPQDSALVQSAWFNALAIDTDYAPILRIVD